MAQLDWSYLISSAKPGVTEHILRNRNHLFCTRQFKLSRMSQMTPTFEIPSRFLWKGFSLRDWCGGCPRYSLTGNATLSLLRQTTLQTQNRSTEVQWFSTPQFCACTKACCDTPQTQQRSSVHHSTVLCMHLTHMHMHLRHSTEVHHTTCAQFYACTKVPHNQISSGKKWPFPYSSYAQMRLKFLSFCCTIRTIHLYIKALFRVVHTIVL